MKVHARTGARQDPNGLSAHQAQRLVSGVERRPRQFARLPGTLGKDRVERLAIAAQIEEPGVDRRQRLDQQLAQLLDVPAAELAGTRGSAMTDTPMVFEVAGGSTAIEVVVDRDRLAGQVLAGTVTEVDLERASGAVDTVTVDELGRFFVEQPAAGPARLRLRGGSPRSVVTDWFLV